MHKFNLYDEHRQYFSPKIIAMVTKLYQYKGRLEVFTETMEKDLSLFIPVAKRHSAIASNKISGITAPDSRLDKLFAPNAEPKKGNEEEILIDKVNNFGYEKAFVIPTTHNQDKKIIEKFLQKAHLSYNLV